MLQITLFTKAPCPLCDDVKAELAAMAVTFPHVLKEIDITQDRELYSFYRYLIPVLKIGDELTLRAPITRGDLMRALRQAAQ